MAVGSSNNQGYNKFAFTPSTAGAAQTEVIDAIYKKFYLPAVRDLLNNKKILTRYVRTNTEDVAGEEAVISVNIGRNEGIGHIYEQGKLPDPLKQKYSTLRYGIRQFYGRILFSGLSSAASKNDRGAFIRVMDGEIKGLARDMQVEFNRILFGDGSGRIARLYAVNGSTYTWEKPGGFDQNLGLGTQYIRDGMRVCVVRTDGVSPEAANSWGLFQTNTGNRAYYVYNTNYAAGTCQFVSTPESTSPQALVDAASAALAPSGSVNWYMFRASETSTSISQQDTAMWAEPFGLAAIVDDANPQGAFSGGTNYVGGLDATANSIWRAAVVDNGGVPVPFSQDLLQQGMDLVDQISDGVVQMWMTTHGIRRQYVNALVSNKRYVGTMELDGGFSAVTYDERPIVVDKDCTRGRIYGLDLDTLMMFMLNDYQWMDADGSILQRLLDKDAYQATLYRYHQFGTDARNRNVLIADIQDY